MSPVIDPSVLDLSSLPWMPLSAKTGLVDSPGIYFAVDSCDVVQYIGQSQGVRGRWSSHHRFAELDLMGGVKICYLQIEDKSLLLPTEKALISFFSPALNGRRKRLFQAVSRRKRRTFKLDPRVVSGLAEKAKSKGRSANSWLEAYLFQLFQGQGFLPEDAEPLGETRGGALDKSEA